MWVNRFKLVVLGQLVALVCGCSSMEDPWKGVQGSPKVLVTFPPLFSMVKQVAGGGAAVQCLCTTTGPHHYNYNARDAIFEKRRVMVADANSLPAEIPLEDQRTRLMASMRWIGQIDIQLASLESNKGFKLIVSDDGIGMSEEARRRCLETGFSTKKDQAIYQGTNSGMGLGLTFVAGVARHHGAHLDIESNMAQGTTLRIVFAMPHELSGTSS